MTTETTTMVVGEATSNKEKAKPVSKKHVLI